MKKFMFSHFILSLLLIIILGKIYQHNRIIHASYKKQRVEDYHKKLFKERDDLLVKFAELTNYQEVKKIVSKNFYMEAVPLSRVITFTGISKVSIDQN